MIKASMKLISIFLAALSLSACSGIPKIKTSPKPLTTVASKATDLAEVSRSWSDPYSLETGDTKYQTEDKLDKIRLGPTDYGDAGSTAVALASGLSEANPLYAWSGFAAPVLALPLKYGIKKGFVSIGLAPARANWIIETAGMFATCNNLTALAGGITPAALGLGAFCALSYSINAKNGYEERTGRTLDSRLSTH